MIVDEPRNATCTAAGDKVEVFALDKAEFKKALETAAYAVDSRAPYSCIAYAARSPNHPAISPRVTSSKADANAA